MCESILSKLQDKNKKDSHGNIPLHIAATKGYFSICKLFIENGMDLNSKNNKGETPFTLAYEKGHGKVIDLIAFESFNQNLDMGITTPLHIIAERGNLELCKTILTKKEDKNPKDSHGNIPLHIASKNGHHDLCKLFIENGMDLESKNNSVATPLQLAKDNLHVEIVELIAYQLGIRHQRRGTRRAKKRRLN